MYTITSRRSRESLEGGGSINWTIEVTQHDAGNRDR